MELDDRAKEAVRELGDAINAAVGESMRVAEAVDRLREIGYESNLSLKLEIGLFELETPSGEDETTDDILNETELDLTDDDLKTLRSMKIRLE